MKFIVAFVVLSVAVASSHSQAIPYGYRYTFPYAAPAPLAAAPAPAAPASGSYKTETFSTGDLSKSEIRDEAGQYSLSYITANGIRVTERGYLKASAEGYVPVKEGTYEYTSPDGTPVSYGYKADENGYVVKGYPLPLGPVPVPAKA